jgi:outer membrane receptor for ferrienterochelin and colicins
MPIIRSYLFATACAVALFPALAHAAEDDNSAETITVTGQRTLRAGALDETTIVKTEVFDLQAVDNTHAVNINEVLDKHPGISVQTECSICNVRNITLNNLPGRFTTLMIDGIPLFSSLSSAYGLDSVNVRGIERIEVARGAGTSLIAPEAISGVVNIVTRKPSGTELEAVSDIGNFGWRNAQGYAGFGGDRFGVSVSGGYQTHDSIDADGNGITEYTGYERYILGAAVFANDLAGFDIKVRADLIHEDRGGGAVGSDYAAIKASTTGNPFDFSKGPSASPVAGGWFAPDGSGFVPYNDGRGGFSEIIFTRRQQVLGSAERDIAGGRLRFAAGYAHNKQDSFYELATYVAQTDQSYLEASYRFNIGKAKLTVGGNYRYEDLASTGFNAAGANTSGLDDYVYKVPGAFVQIYAPFAGDKAELNISARIDDHNIFGTILSPRANLLWHHSDRLSSRFAIGRGFRAPTSFFEQDHGILDTVRVERLIDKPERSTNASYALNYSDDRWIATATYNYTRVTNLALLDSGAIDPINGDPITLFTSAVNPVTVNGIDANFSFKAAPGLTLSAAAEKYWFKFDQGVLPFARPDFKAFASVNWDVDRFHLFARATYTGGQNLKKFHGTDRFNLDGTSKRLTTPQFVTIDARAEVHLLGEQLSVFAGVDNLTGYQQAKRDGFLWLDSTGAIDVTHLWGPNRGRFLYAGIKVSY